MYIVLSAVWDSAFCDWCQILTDKASKILIYWMGCCVTENVRKLWNKCCPNLGPEARVGPRISPLPPSRLGHPQLCWLHAGPWSQGNIYKRKKDQIFWLLKYCCLFFRVRNPKYIISKQLLRALQPASLILALAQCCFARQFRMASMRGGMNVSCVIFESQLFEAVQKFGILEVVYWLECNWSC